MHHFFLVEYTLKFSPKAVVLMVCAMMNDLDICLLNVALSARLGVCERARRHTVAVAASEVMR